MIKRKAILLSFLVVLVGFSFKSWSFEPPSFFYDFDTSLYQLDVAYKGANNSNEFQYKWVNIMDQFLLKMFNESDSIKYNDNILMLEYNDNYNIKMRGDKISNIQCYELDFQVGPFDSPEMDDAQRSKLEFEVRPIDWNGNIYYFIIIKRLVNTVEQFGIFRIIGKINNNYTMIARQEESLPSLSRL